jgi:hypothetical protein
MAKQVNQYVSPYNQAKAKGDIFGQVSAKIARVIVPGEAEEQDRAALYQAQADCHAQGGIWDPVNKICRPKPKEQTQQQQQPEQAPTTPKIWGTPIAGKYDKERGGYVTDSGAFYKTSDENFVPTHTYEGVDFNKDGTVSVRKGDTVITASKEEYENYLKLTAGQGGLPTAKAKELMALPNEEQFGQQQQQARMQKLMELAQQGLITSEELQAIQGATPNWGQAAGAGLTSVIPGLAGGAVAGAVAGAAVGGVGAPVGAVIGGAAGALGTFLSGARSSIKQQQAGEFSADQTALSRGQTMLRSLITDTNRNPQNAPENIALFYQTLSMIDVAHARTYRDSQEDLNKFLGNDGTEQLAKFEVFDSTMRQYYIQAFEASLMQPNPNMNLITEEDLTGI